jgi:hypothetical protein
MKLVLNFGHILNTKSASFLRDNLGEFVYLHRRLRVDFHQSIKEQITGLVDSVEEELITVHHASLEQSDVYVIMPGLTDPTALLLIELYGRTGTFPNILMMRREHHEFVVYDIVDSEKMKFQSRGKRKSQETLDKCLGRFPTMM